MKELELGRFLPFRLSLLSNLVSNGIAQTYQPRYALSVTQWRVIAIVGRHAGISAQEIAERSAMDKVAVSRAVAALTNRSLLSRGDDPSDRRRLTLSLTEEGSRVYADVIPAALRFESELIAHLSVEEKTALEDLLDKMTERAKTLSDTARG